MLLLGNRTTYTGLAVHYWGADSSFLNLIPSADGNTYLTCIFLQSNKTVQKTDTKREIIKSKYQMLRCYFTAEFNSHNITNIVITPAVMSTCSRLPWIEHFFLLPKMEQLYISTKYFICAVFLDMFEHLYQIPLLRIFSSVKCLEFCIGSW